MTDGGLFRALFAPRAVALVGASGDPAKNTARPQRYLARHGYTGTVLPINPGRDEVLGLPAYPDLAAAPGPIDHVFIMTPAAAVAGVIAQCAAAGVGVATVYSDGFAETGADGMARQADIVARAHAAGVRLIGPNSMGVVNVTDGVAVTVNAALETDTLIRGGIGVVSHSGTVLGTLISRGQARGLGFSKLVSIGNEADLSVGEIADLLVDDPATEVILLFLETIRDPAALAAMARRAYDAGKPVIAYKLGRSEVGRRLALSHSGALAGPDAAASEFFRHHGIVRVDMMESMLEIAPLIRGRRPPGGGRVAVLTTTGGGASMVADRLGLLGVGLVTPPPRLVGRLAGLGIRLEEAPIIDVTMAGARPEVYGAAIAELMSSPECDAVVAVVGSSAQFHPEIAVRPIIDAAAGAAKPVAAFLVPQADRSLRLLAEAGVPAFRTPEACADAMRAYLDWRAPAPPAAPAEPPPVAAALAAADGRVLDEAAARAVFAELGIEQAPAHGYAAGEGSRVGYPVAVKAVSPALSHRSDVGAVVLGAGSAEEIDALAAGIRARVAAAVPDLGEVAILVQRMEDGVGEALVGYRDNPETGPVVIVGVGGTLAEIVADVEMRLAPVGIDTARDMVKRVRGLATIRGARGRARGDVEALAHAVAAMSRLALVPGSPVAEAEINPLIVRADGTGVVAVDCLLVLREA